jgi:uncharacterized protein involved in oxidation of intracellular sulfur
MLVGLRYAVIINNADPENVWNALRFCNTALSRGHEVTVFLLGPAVELDELVEKIDSSTFNIKKLYERFKELGGRTLSCGTCMRIRGLLDKPFVAFSVRVTDAAVSTMDELVRLTEEADRVVVFG